MLRQLITGTMQKRYHQSGHAEDDEYGDQIKCMDQLNKTDLTVMLERMDSNEWPLEMWDSYKDVGLDELLVLVYIMTGGGPKTVIPSNSRAESREIWAQCSVNDLQNVPHAFP